MIKSFLPFLATALLTASSLQAAVVLDNSQAFAQLGDNPADQQYTVGADANFLVVAVSSFDKLLDDITYNGTSLTRIQTLFGATDARSQQEIWVLEDPTSGQNTLSFSESGTRFLNIVALSFEDVASYIIHDTDNAEGGSVTGVTTANGSAMLGVVAARQNYALDELSGAANLTDLASNSGLNTAGNISNVQVGYDLNTTLGDSFTYEANATQQTLTALELVAVPEPSALTLALGAIGIILVFRRRR